MTWPYLKNHLGTRHHHGAGIRRPQTLGYGSSPAPAGGSGTYCCWAEAGNGLAAGTAGLALIDELAWGKNGEGTAPLTPPKQAGLRSYPITPARLYKGKNLEAALAEAEASTGAIAAGLQRLEDALAEAERTEERWYEAEIYRIRADILLKRNPADTTRAEQALQAAIAIAQSQKARSFELRTALSLAKLYRTANRDADAHAVLGPAVEGFPPTQQFPELTEAQTLLAALNP